MMDWVRKNVALIAGITVGVMVLWLVGTAVSIRSMQGNFAGILFGRKIAVETYAKSLDAVTRQAVLNHGDKFREEIQPEELEQMAWQRLTLLLEAQRRKVRVSDSEVVEYLQRWQLFQRNGQFDPASYQAIIQYSLGTTPRQFEEEVREMLMILKLTEAAAKTTVSEEDIRQEFQSRAETIKITYVLFPGLSAAKEVSESVRQNPKSLDDISQQTRLPLRTTGFFSRFDTVPNIGPADKIFRPAFDLAIGESAGPLQSPKGWLIIRVEAKKPADFSKLDAQKANLMKELLEKKQLNAYISWYSELVKRADLKKLLPTGKQESEPQPPPFAD